MSKRARIYHEICGIIYKKTKKKQKEGYRYKDLMYFNTSIKGKPHIPRKLKKAITHHVYIVFGCMYMTAKAIEAYRKIGKRYCPEYIYINVQRHKGQSFKNQKEFYKWIKSVRNF